MQLAKVRHYPEHTEYIANITGHNQFMDWIILLYGPLLFFAKFSVLLQLHHIFVVGHRQPIFTIIQALIWVNLSFYHAFLFVDIFQCVPRRKIWDSTVLGKCISIGTILIAPAVFNIVSDSLLLVLPIVLIFRLKLTLKNKLAIVLVFSSGFLSLCPHSFLSINRE